MKITGRGATYDRQRILEVAARARARNQRRKAIECYRWVLAVERSNAELHAKLAPLLAETSQDFDAWNSFRAVSQAALREGREDKALAVYREAAQYLPREIQIWQGLGRLLAKRGEEAEAVEALLEGSRNFRTPYLRPQAIHLLRRARTIDPWHFEVVIELSLLLGRCEQRREAAILLEGLAGRCQGRRLRRVRAAELRLRRNPRTAWRWLRTLFSRSVEDASEPPPQPLRSVDGQGVVPLRAARR